MITKSKEHNPNYLAKVILVKGLKKHPNADRLQVLDVDFQQVITGLDTNEGDIFVYFPVESKISKEFLSYTNSFRDKTLNKDNSKAGFFDEKGRVKAVKLRGEKSMGYIVPFDTVIEWSGLARSLKSDFINQEFDTINGKLLVEKYVIKTKEPRTEKQGKKPKVSRLIDGQIHLHIDTENLRKNAYKINPDNIVSITYKTHGTSWWVGNVIVKKHLPLWQRLLKKLGANVIETGYDLVYGSRRVVKNADLEDPKAKDHYFGYDLWEKVKEEIGDVIPKGYTLYGELIGYDHNGKYIQKGYDYGCKEGEHKLEVYRITNTTPDGLVTELTYPEIREFCDKVGLNTPHLFYYGKAKYWDKSIKLDSHWNERFVKNLENAYNDKKCFICQNKVPEEGIVVRKESLFSCNSFKLKSFSFLEWETKQLDSGEVDLESSN